MGLHEQPELVNSLLRLYGSASLLLMNDSGLKLGHFHTLSALRDRQLTHSNMNISEQQQRGGSGKQSCQ